MSVRVFEVLNWYDGVIEFLAVRPGQPRQASGGKEYTPLTECVYGVLASNSFGEDKPRVYDCWTLPPRSVEPEFQIDEETLEFEHK